MKIISIIPARMGSSRFPGKPMAKILEKPMIGHVLERVSKSMILDKTIVATCDKIIFEYIQSIGGQAIMTSDKHVRASDRCAEALSIIEKRSNVKYDIVVMVQGDEPMVEPEMIEEAVNPMIHNRNIKVSNLLGEIKNNREFKDRNCIKVVTDIQGDAIYFSRSPIPYQDKFNKKLIGKQVCIIPFQKDFLYQYLEMNPTPLEVLESIDMLRILESGYKVRMIKTKFLSSPVDTLNDLKKVEKLMRKQQLLS